MDTQEFFDEQYSKFNRYWWLGENRYSLNPDDHLPFHATILQIMHNRTPGRVLDIGAGEGSEAIRFALLGHQVDVVELSPVASGKIRNFASECNINLNIINMDIRNYQFKEQYDLIICNGVLHYIADKISILQRVQQATLQGGYNMIALFSTFNTIPEPHKLVSVYPDEEDGIVVHSYKDWKIIYSLFEHNKLEASHPSFDTHVHSFIKLIACKPTNAEEGGAI
jgi:2-polyprenyl-3-methyl-5-hydroxy-6-metoxy-1,4-benzoquinol methylase